LPPDLAHAIDLEVLLKNARNLGLEGQIAPGLHRELRRGGPLGSMRTVGQRGDRQDPADRLDPAPLTMHGSHEEAEAAIKAGNFSFLSDDEGKFITNSIVSIPPK
jgi:hypothetical protein